MGSYELSRHCSVLTSWMCCTCHQLCVRCISHCVIVGQCLCLQKKHHILCSNLLTSLVPFSCIMLYFSELNFCHLSCVGNGCRKTFGTVHEHTPPRQMEEYADAFRTLHKIIFKSQLTVIISKLST